MEYLSQNYVENVCFTKSELEVVKTIELETKSQNFELGGFSALDYNELTDQLFLLSEFNNGYLVKINDFSKIINLPQKKVFLNEEDIINFKYNFLAKYFRKGDGEGLKIIGSSIYVLNENIPWTWRRPFSNFYQPATFQEYDLRNGKIIKSINLPKSMEKNTSGIESLAISSNGLFFLSQ